MTTSHNLRRITVAFGLEPASGAVRAQADYSARDVAGFSFSRFRPTLLQNAGAALSSAVLAGLLLWMLIAPVTGAFGAHAWMLLVVAPLIEETVFRCGVHEFLLRHRDSARLANVATALLFAGAHALVRAEASALLVAIPAWFIGRIYERWHRLRYCIVLHAAMNVLWLAWAVGRRSSLLGH